MNEKVIIRIEYERDGTRRTFYGEIDEDKLEVFHAGEESFMCLMNDGKMAWIDKEAIVSVYEPETKLRIYEKYYVDLYLFKWISFRDISITLLFIIRPSLESSFAWLSKKLFKSSLKSNSSTFTFFL